MSVLMIDITFLFHWCVCDISCEYVFWYCWTLQRHCKELPQSTVGLMSFAAGVSNLFTSVTDFNCMIQIDDDDDDDDDDYDDDGYMNVNNDITFLYKTKHTVCFLKNTTALLLFLFLLLLPGGLCYCIWQHPVVTSEAVTTESRPRSESAGCLKFASL
jgi:hypothetical protein